MKFDLENSLTKLDQITSKLNAPGVKLDEALKLFKQASQLASKCRAYLTECEQQVKILTEANHLADFDVNDLDTDDAGD